MANRSPRTKLKRVLSENCIRNIEANMNAILPFLELYIDSDESAQQVATSLITLLELHDMLLEAIKTANDTI